MRIYEQNRKWFTDAHAQGVNIWYNETFGGDDVCEIKIMKVKNSHHTLFPDLSNWHSSCCRTLACIFWMFKLFCLCYKSFFWLIIQSVRLFMATYCHALGADVRCNGCNVKLMNKDKWYRCRYCINVNLWTQCFENSFTDASTGHSSSHETAIFKLVKIHYWNKIRQKSQNYCTVWVIIQLTKFRCFSNCLTISSWLGSIPNVTVVKDTS